MEGQEAEACGRNSPGAGQEPILPPNKAELPSGAERRLTMTRYRQSNPFPSGEQPSWSGQTKVDRLSAEFEIQLLRLTTSSKVSTSGFSSRRSQLRYVWFSGCPFTPRLLAPRPTPITFFCFLSPSPCSVNSRFVNVEVKVGAFWNVAQG